MKIHVLMPAFNEEEGLEKLLSRVKRALGNRQDGYRVVCVNDGSSDHTLQVLECFKKDMPLEIINFQQNRGVTEVFRAGFEYILNDADSDDIIVTMDSDNTQSPYTISDLCAAIDQGSEIAVASRFVKNASFVGIPLHRQILSNGVSILLSRMFPINGISDYSTFYRAYRARVLQEASDRIGINQLISGTGFSSMARLLIILAKERQIKCAEVPVRLRYDLKEGGSGMRIGKSITGYVKLMNELSSFASDTFISATVKSMISKSSWKRLFFQP